LHILERIIEDIDRTHKGLGKLLAMSLVATKANMCMLTIAPSGCGKSRVTDTLLENLPISKYKLDSVTRAALKRM